MKVALVTGSGRKRLGNVVARGLAEDGFALAIHYNRSAQTAAETACDLSALGVEAETFQADVSRDDDVQGMFDAIVRRFGRLDVLACTASIWSAKPLDQVTADDVRRNFEINTLGTFLCAQRGGMVMAGQTEGGSIITFGDWAIQRPYPDHSAYFVSKGAIPTLTRALAVELGNRNPRVRVNCIHPGPVLFPDDMSAGERQEVIASTLVKHANCPESVLSAVRFFVENTFVTGVCLPVDGGRTIFADEARGAG